MANKNMKAQYNLQTDVVELDGYVCLDSSAAVVAATTKFPNASVAKTTTGVYTITLADPYPYIVGVSATYTCLTGSTGIRCEVSKVLTGTTTSVVVKTTNAAGAPVDVSVPCGFYVVIKCKNTSVAQ